jgi:hypothetical protein
MKLFLFSCAAQNYFFSSPVQHEITLLLFFSQFRAAFEIGKKSGTAMKYELRER